MTNQHTQWKRAVAGIALAGLVFGGALGFTGALAAQTAETQSEVVFHVQMLQAERAAGDKLAAEARPTSTPTRRSRRTSFATQPTCHRWSPAKPPARRSTC